MADEPAAGLAAALGLAPHPEGGWYRRTWTAPTTVDTSQGTRPTATAILYLLDAPTRWHRVRSTELWCWHAGPPVTLLLAGSGPAPAAATGTLLGTPADGGFPQVEVPPQVWQAARPVRAEPALVSCVVSPGFDFADFELFPEP